MIRRRKVRWWGWGKERIDEGVEIKREGKGKGQRDDKGEVEKRVQVKGEAEIV